MNPKKEPLWNLWVLISFQAEQKQAGITPPQLPVILDYRTVGLCTLNTLKSRTFCQASAKPGTSHLPRTTNAENTQVTHPVHNFYKRVQNKSQSVHIHTVVYTHLSMSMSLCMYVYVHIYIYTPYSALQLS